MAQRLEQQSVRGGKKMLIKFDNYEQDLETLAKELPSPIPEDNMAGRKQAIQGTVLFLVTL